MVVDIGANNPVVVVGSVPPDDEVAISTRLDDDADYTRSRGGISPGRGLLRMEPFAELQVLHRLAHTTLESACRFGQAGGYQLQAIHTLAGWTEISYIPLSTFLAQSWSMV